MPKTSGATRQPNEFIPKKCSPAAISHLPTGGWTMNDAVVLHHVRRCPATIWALALLGPVPLVAELQQRVRVLGVVGLVEDQLVRVGRDSTTRMREGDGGDAQGDQPAGQPVGRHRRTRSRSTVARAADRRWRRRSIGAGRVGGATARPTGPGSTSRTWRVTRAMSQVRRSVPRDPARLGPRSVCEAERGEPKTSARASWCWPARPIGDVADASPRLRRGARPAPT